MSFGFVRLNHAVLFVTDLKRSEQFYRDVFGMEVVSHEEAFRAVFLRFPDSGNHHDLGLFSVGLTAPKPPRGSVGLYHLAWQVDTIEDLASARERLIAANALRGESSHGATKSLYGVDPDGNEFEVMWMLPRDSWGVYEAAATVEPLHLEDEIAAWSGVRTGGRVAVAN